MKLTCGLEVHAQLLSAQKLFSGTSVGAQMVPNTRVSFFDAALPGVLPILNQDCLKLAIRAAVALNAKVQRKISFDRKHYMYPDQPAGYQITQKFQPFAQNGYLDILSRDISANRNKSTSTANEIRVRIKQLQIEQDTGKTIYSGDNALIDLNRTNTGLVELVTEPDITSPEAAGAFVRKLQRILKHLGVCSGEMESGAMRVDVNVSVDYGTRCEVKNLFSPSAVVAAIKAEFARQKEVLRAGGTIKEETRGWDGSKTFKMRDKDTSVDYRYMPDPELPSIVIPSSVVDRIQNALPPLPDQVVDSLIDQYSLSLVDARTIFDQGPEFIQLFEQIHRDFSSQRGSNTSLVNNWLVHRWLGESTLPPPREAFSELLLFIDDNTITAASGKLILKHIAQSLDTGDRLRPISELVNEYGLSIGSQDTDLDAIYAKVIADNPDVVERIQKGKANSISFLLGQVMRETQGTIQPQEAKSALIKLINEARSL